MQRRSAVTPAEPKGVNSGDTKPKRRRKLKKAPKTTPMEILAHVVIIVLLAVIVFLVCIYIYVLFGWNSVKGSEITRGLRYSMPGSSFGNPSAFPNIVRDQATKEKISPEALEMCTRTLWHTLETTTIVLPDEDTFIHTGDIDDLWLRDSAAQIHPLLMPFFNGTSLVQQDPKLDRIVSGLIKRTAMYIRHDPYANAFRIDDSYQFSAAQRRLGRHDLISTWNYELDSACYYIRMLYYYWKQRPDAAVLKLQSVKEAVSIMVDLWKAEQKHELDEYPVGPLFDCKNCNKPYRYPGLARDGKGTPTNASSGLIWTGFRPSDDECKFGFLVPANMFAVVALGYVVEMSKGLWRDRALATKAQSLAKEVDDGIQRHAKVESGSFGTIYAYEVDGLGGNLLMDDANIPSLLSIPYLGYDEDPIVYENTRKFILSSENPTYNKGSPITASNGEQLIPEGYGSPHMEARIKKNIWPMSIAVMGLTSSDTSEKLRLVEILVQTTGGTGWMHESFNAFNPKQFTRAWFCWSDSLFAELVLSLTDACPLPSHLYKVLEWRDPTYVSGAKFALETTK